MSLTARIHTVLAASLLGLLVALPIIAAEATPGLPLIPDACTGSQGAGTASCGIVELLQVGANLYRYLLGIVGSVTLAVFIYGGVVWLTAAGNTQRIDHGRKVFEGALVGLALIFGSWLIVYFIVAALTGAAPGSPAILFPGQEQQRPALQEAQ